MLPQFHKLRPVKRQIIKLFEMRIGETRFLMGKASGRSCACLVFSKY